MRQTLAWALSAGDVSMWSANGVAGQWARGGPASLRSSVMVAGRQKVDARVADLIDKPVFGIDAARPATGELATKSFGLTHSSEGIAEDRFHQFERAQGAFPIGSRPVTQVFKERRIEYSLSALRSRHSPAKAKRRLSLSRSTASPSSESARAMASRSLSAFLGERSR